MIKKILLIIATLVLAQQTYATTATSAATSTPKANSIDDLKERLATKVAEMRQTQKKAIYGTIKTVSVSTITVETKTSDVKIELTDAIKVFQTIKEKRTTLTQEDLEKGDIVSVFGDYDSGLDLLKAKVIVIQDAPAQRISGVVTGIDKKEFTATIDIGEGKTYIVDIEKTTSVYGFDIEKGVVKGGFSKLEVGAIAHVVGTAVPKKENRISAIRFLDMGNLTGVPVTPTPTVMSITPTATASSTPKATPKPTTKATPTPTTTAP
jgi:hypothetical protein